jgi:stromal membrane-associated protein
LYWEAHLKAGHVPPEHKVESFIRSKYEVKRWAKEGPVPSDPSILDGGSSTAATPASASSSAAPASSSTASSKARAPAASAVDLLGGDVGPGPATTSVSRPRNSSLLDSPPPPSSTAGVAPVAATAAKVNAASPAAATKTSSAAGAGGGLFDLDWHSGPTSPTDSAAPSTKGNKKDILSLYSNTSPRQPSAGLDAFGSMNLGSQQPSVNVTSAASNPWGAASMQQQPAPPNAGRATNLFSTQDVWGSPSTTTAAAPSLSNDFWGEMTSGTTTTNSTRQTAPQNDAFADIWK